MSTFSKFQVSSYYDINTLFYRVFWYSRRSLGIHFGYYDPDIKNHDDAILRVNEALAKLADIKPEDKVLDAGCGVGGSSIWLAKNIGSHVTGITISSVQIRKAGKYSKDANVADKTEFLVKDFNDTGFPNGSFDVVWAVESLCHAEDKSIVMKEMFRVLKPGGKLIMSDWFQGKDELNSDERILLDEFIHGFAVPSIETPKTFKSILEKVGFEAVKQTDRGQDIANNLKFGMPRTRRLGLPAKILPKIIPALKEVTMNYYGILACDKAYAKGLWTIQTVYATKPLK